MIDHGAECPLDPLQAGGLLKLEFRSPIAGDSERAAGLGAARLGGPENRDVRREVRKRQPDGAAVVGPLHQPRGRGIGIALGEATLLSVA